jgi:hypothetical protein
VSSTSAKLSGLAGTFDLRLLAHGTAGHHLNQRSIARMLLQPLGVEACVEILEETSARSVGLNDANSCSG